MAIVSSSAANQPPPLVDYDLFAQDRPLVEALWREGGGAYEERVGVFGQRGARVPGRERLRRGVPAVRGSSARAR